MPESTIAFCATAKGGYHFQAVLWLQTIVAALVQRFRHMTWPVDPKGTPWPEALDQMSTEQVRTDNQDGRHSHGTAALFVYGTLRRGRRSHELLRRFRPRFVATGHIKARLYDLGKYPGALESTRDDERVYGEVYLLPHAAWAFSALDKFEGFEPVRLRFNSFVRKKTTVYLPGGAEIEAWIYWLSSARSFGRRVRSGDYTKCRE